MTEVGINWYKLEVAGTLSYCNDKNKATKERIAYILEVNNQSPNRTSPWKLKT